ncbi:MAG: hypothetical protein DDT19_01384 [Syntrophomonadaceae bacterium]|nr:hypothetical protein [Bacillota bacterium]
MGRFNFRNTRIRQQLRSFDLQLKQLDYFLKNIDVVKSDLEKLKSASKTLSQVSKKLQSSPEKWAIVIAIGWWKMLESSGMPGLTDEILKEGFSPKDWTLKSISSSLDLAMEVAKQFGEISNSKVVTSFLNEIGISDVRDISMSSGLELETIQKVKKVLRWNESMEYLTQVSIKMLGFFWFSMFILELANLVPISEEASPKFIDTIWSNIENLLENSRSALFKELEKIINAINSKIEQLIGKKVNWAENIFYLPEVI